MITRFHNGSWWAYSSEFDSDTGPYSTEEQAQNFIDRADHWFEAGRLLAARVDELESALRGYVKATTGQESATVTFPMALGRRREVRIVTDYKHAQQIIIELDAEVERLQARVDALEGMEHKYGDEYSALKAALANSEGENHE